jgi:two-component system OmpR family response regulator
VASLHEFGVSNRQAAGRILIVEDDPELAEAVRDDLTDRGYHVQRAASGGDGAGLAAMMPFDVIIVDRLLPELDGLSLIAQLRAADVPTPVLIISALSDVDERVRGLKAGGDDYLTKPFALAELAARVEALMRRPLPTRATMLKVGPISLDLIDRVVRRGEQVIELLPREYKLLEYLMRRPGQLVTRAMLLENVWHYRFIPETNLVDVHIGKLRRKIDNRGEPSLIQVVRGQGFVFRDGN